MWKHFIPPSFRITWDQQSRIEKFIDIGDAFIQNLAKFSRLEKDFKNNLDFFLSEQERERTTKESKRKAWKASRVWQAKSNRKACKASCWGKEKRTRGIWEKWEEEKRWGRKGERGES